MKKFKKTLAAVLVAMMTFQQFPVASVYADDEEENTAGEVVEPARNVHLSRRHASRVDRHFDHTGRGGRSAFMVHLAVEHNDIAAVEAVFHILVTAQERGENIVWL